MTYQIKKGTGDREKVKNMLNMIRLLHGECRATSEEMKKFKKGDTIWGNDENPEELKRWSMEHGAEGRSQERAFCSPL